MTGLARRTTAELLGTATLVAVVVGSGIAAQRLSPTDTGLQLLHNSVATVFGLYVLVTVLGPVSGAHLNPVVSLADAWLGRRDGGGLGAGELAVRVPAQVLGGIGGAVLANAMFEVPIGELATTGRSGVPLWLGEVVATAGLVLVVMAVVRTDRAHLAAPAVAAWIGAAYWFTSSTSFANPAVTVGRMFSDTFAGVAPGSVPAFVLSQLLGAAVGVALGLVLFPRPPSLQGDPALPLAEAPVPAPARD